MSLELMLGLILVGIGLNGIWLMKIYWRLGELLK